MGAPFGIAIASFTLFFSLTAGIIKKVPKITRNKKKKHDKIFILAISKLNSMEISHEEFVAILNKRDKFKETKENLKNVSEKQQNMKLNSVNSKNKKMSL